MLHRTENVKSKQGSEADCAVAVCSPVPIPSKQGALRQGKGSSPCYDVAGTLRFLCEQGNPSQTLCCPFEWKRELGSENIPGSYCSGARHSCPHMQELCGMQGYGVAFL